MRIRRCKKMSAEMRVIICAIPLIVIPSVMLLKNAIIKFCEFLPACVYLETFGVYCPGCGNRRSVFALLSGDVIGSLRNNVMPLVLIAVCALFYAELVLRAFGVRWRSPVRRLPVIITLLVLLSVYYVLRNFIPALAPL